MNHVCNFFLFFAKTHALEGNQSINGARSTAGRQFKRLRYLQYTGRDKSALEERKGYSTVGSCNITGFFFFSYTPGAA